MDEKNRRWALILLNHIKLRVQIIQGQLGRYYQEQFRSLVIRRKNLSYHNYSVY